MSDRMPSFGDLKMPGQLVEGWYKATIIEAEFKLWPDSRPFISVGFEIDGEGEIAKGAYNLETDEGDRNVEQIKKLKALSVYAGLGAEGNYEPEDLLEKKVGVRVGINKKGYPTVWETADLNDERKWLNDGVAADEDVPF